MSNERCKRILVVDDEGPVREICVRILEPLGFTVTVAANGDQGLAAFEAQTSDLVLTDYKMPGTWNGVMLGEAIKQLAPHTQVILMTAFPDVENAVGTLRLGGFDYLVKPFDKKDLIQCVEACFARLATA